MFIDLQKERINKRVKCLPFNSIDPINIDLNGRVGTEVEVQQSENSIWQYLKILEDKL